MYFTKEEFLREDPLKVLRFVSIDLFKQKIVKILLILLLIINLLSIVAQIYFLLSVFEINYFVKYSPIFFGNIFLVTSIAATLIMTEFLENSFFQLELWYFNSNGQKLLEQIYFESEILTIFTLVMTFLALYSGYQFAIPMHDDRDIFLYIALIQDYFPNYKDVLCGIFRLTYLPSAVVMTTPFYQFLYYCLHFKFQAHLGLHLVSNIEEETSSFDEDILPYENDFQNSIRKKVKFIIIRENKIYKVAGNILKSLNLFLYLFTISSTLLASSVLFFFYMYEGSILEKVPRLASLSIVCSSLFIYIIITGQNIEDLSTQGSDIIRNFKWYNWNKENKQMYLLATLHSIKPFKIQFTDNIAVNYELGISIIKAVYSVISVTKRLRN